MSLERPASSSKARYEIRTVHEKDDSVSALGSGSFGSVERARAITQLMRENEDGTWRIERERTSAPDSFVIKTFHTRRAEDDARYSVRRYQELKDAGVRGIPGTHRLSDSNPRVVISTLLGKGTLLVTSNAGPASDAERPTSIDTRSFVNMLERLQEDLERMSEKGLMLEDPDALFFEVTMQDGRAVNVEHVFGDFDSINLGLDFSSTFRENVIQATKALFRLMMVQRIKPGMANWKEIAARIRLWASTHNVDATLVYKDFEAEIREYHAKTKKQAGA